MHLVHEFQLLLSSSSSVLWSIFLYSRMKFGNFVFRDHTKILRIFSHRSWNILNFYAVNFVKFSVARCYFLHLSPLLWSQWFITRNGWLQRCSFFSLNSFNHNHSNGPKCSTSAIGCTSQAYLVCGQKLFP